MIDKTSEILTQMRKIIRAIDLHSNKLMKKFNMTGPQLIVSTTLMLHNKISVTDLAEKVHLSKPTLVSILDRLALKNYIFREKDEKDKRKVYIKPTCELLKFLENNPPNLLQESFTDKFSALPDWEQSLILSSFEKVADMMKATEIEAAPILHPNSDLEKEIT